MTSIVVIDDVKSNRQILGKIIQTIDPSIAIHNFDCAELALGWINAQTPDLVITDYKMPGLDGIEFTKQLRSQSKSREDPNFNDNNSGRLGSTDIRPRCRRDRDASPTGRSPLGAGSN